MCRHIENYFVNHFVLQLTSIVSQQFVPRIPMNDCKPTNFHIIVFAQDEPWPTALPTKWTRSASPDTSNIPPIWPYDWATDKAAFCKDVKRLERLLPELREGSVDTTDTEPHNESQRTPTKLPILPRHEIRKAPPKPSAPSEPPESLTIPGAFQITLLNFHTILKIHTMSQQAGLSNNNSSEPVNRRQSAELAIWIGGYE